MSRNARTVALIVGAAVATLIGGAMALSIILAATLGPVRPTPVMPAPVTASVAPVPEDSPSFDCATMGNRQCGPWSVPLSTYCQAERSDVAPEGVEVIAYPAGSTVTSYGAPVRCG